MDSKSGKRVILLETVKELRAKYPDLKIFFIDPEAPQEGSDRDGF